MAVLTWDDSGKRLYETGVDHGVLYPLNTVSGIYDKGYAWNGLTTVTETPGGAEANPAYADNIKYLNLLSAETFGGTIEAFTYPDAFGACDGSYSPSAGVSVGQQDRAVFGLSYRTNIGNDVNAALGYKLHLAWGLLASPSEKAYASVNDSPEAVAFSWDFTSSPVTVSGRKPTSLIVIDSTKVTVQAMTDLTTFLYGTAGTDPSLPTPDAVLAIFAAALTKITLTPPTFDSAHTITIPSLTGATYYVDGVVHAAGTQLLTTGQKKIVSATPNVGYAFNEPFVDEWMFTFVS
jgi:hypothetical protein